MPDPFIPITDDLPPFLPSENNLESRTSDPPDHLLVLNYVIRVIVDGLKQNQFDFRTFAKGLKPVTEIIWKNIKGMYF
jgi:hypothetical protein